MSAVTSEAVSQPAPMPRIAPGIIDHSRSRSNTPRQVHSDTRSISTRIGSRIAAACTGEMASAISGTPTKPTAPPKPPLDRPTRMTAGMAAA